jgi:hypothetical protein
MLQISLFDVSIIFIGHVFFGFVQKKSELKAIIHNFFLWFRQFHLPSISLR